MRYYLATIVGIITAYVSAYYTDAAVFMFVGVSIWFYMHLQFEARNIWKSIFKRSPRWFKRWMDWHDCAMPCVMAVWIGYLVGPIVESYAL